MHEKLERPEVLIGSTTRSDAGVRSRHVRHHQRHRGSTKARRTSGGRRGVHQLEESRSFPVDRRADPGYFRGIPQGRRYHVSGHELKRYSIRRRLLATRRQIHALDIAELGYVIEAAPAVDRKCSRSPSSTASAQARAGKARGVRGANQADRPPFQSRFPRRAQLCAKCSTAAGVMMTAATPA